MAELPSRIITRNIKMKPCLSFQFAPRVKFETSVNMNLNFVTSKDRNSILAYYP